ncbi:MAG: hypothetical protein EPN65_10170 [Pandoraea sp.]|uniref:SOS response-associated peptidase family protein n=1 Tax=Pandoraea sp. TaxID=1883445 RepID=UPI00121C2EDA|nr:SOS response-associated peptidase family protein [Pandoraea sp.]TAM17579.1 MAG: hypothetical protein EPN65_10170 [Pandoraea sp.]
MCYSAQIQADFRKYVKTFGAHMSIREFARLYWERAEGHAVKIPKALDLAFQGPGEDDVREIRDAIQRYTAQRSTELETDLFKQRTRQADATRRLEVKQTKAAANDLRISTDKIAADLHALEDLRRTEPKERDARIFPGWYAPVLIVREGRRVIVPMRYRCRLPGWTEEDEREKPGTYNARRDKLTTAWRKLFGHQHGLMIVNAFFENVTGPDGQNRVLRFDPTPAQPMLVACLWNESSTPAGPLLSFAAITDEPPAEVAAAGHDRCIVPIREANLDAWLQPDQLSRDALFAILDDRERPYYEHQLAA